MDIGSKLVENMTPRDVFSMKLFGFSIPVTDTVLTMWFIMVVVTILAIILTKRMRSVPKGKQNVAELIVQSMNIFTEQSIGHHWKMFAPYLGTVFIFLIASNLIGIFNIFPTAKDLYSWTHWHVFEYLPSFELSPPTKDINVTACLAVISMIMVVASCIRIKKFSGWLKSFFVPIPFLFPMKILEYFIRPLSLSLRLFGNILGSFIVIQLVYIAIPPIVPAAFSIYFDMFDGTLQAYIFVFLTSFYIGEAVE